MAINVNPVAVFMTIPSSSTHEMRLARLPLVVIALSEAHPAFGPERPPRPACTAGRGGRFSARARRPTAPGSQRDSERAGPLLAGLRCRARDLRIDTEVVQRARDDRQGNRARLDAAIDGSVVVMPLAAGDGTDGQPDDEQHRSCAHCYLRNITFDPLCDDSVSSAASRSIRASETIWLTCGPLSVGVHS